MYKEIVSMKGEPLLTHQTYSVQTAQVTYLKTDLHYSSCIKLILKVYKQVQLQWRYWRHKLISGRECFLQQVVKQIFIPNKPPDVENTQSDTTVNVSNLHSMDICAKLIFKIGS